MPGIISDYEHFTSLQVFNTTAQDKNKNKLPSLSVIMSFHHARDGQPERSVKRLYGRSMLGAMQFSCLCDRWIHCHLWLLADSS